VQLALIRAHPELAGKAMVAQALTSESTQEQGKAGLTQCTPDEFERIQKLNGDYNARFGRDLETALSANLANMLGPEQAKLVLSPFSSANQWLSEEKVSHFLIKEKGQFELSVKPLDSGVPYVSMTWDGHISSGGPIQEGSLPPFLEETFLPWLERNGLTNGIFRSKP